MSIIKKIIFGGIFFLFFFPSMALAAPEATINTFPSSIQAGEQFSVGVGLSNLETGAKYFVKSVGGDDGYDIKTWSESGAVWLSWDASWESMPSADASVEGVANLTVKSLFREETPLGNNTFLIITRKEGTTVSYNSSQKIITVLAIPTPIPTPTPEPAETPQPTNTPTPQSPSSTPVPTSTPHPTSTPKPTPGLSPAPTSGKAEKVLGTESASGENFNLSLTGDENGTPGGKIKKGKFSFWPFVFIIPGVGMISFSVLLLRKQKV